MRVRWDPFPICFAVIGMLLMALLVVWEVYPSLPDR